MAQASRSRWILLLVVVGVVAGVWWSRRRPRHYLAAYVAVRGLTLWNSTAEVRQPLATLPFGDRLIIMRHSGKEAEVRTSAGVTGWVDGHLLMDSALWGRRTKLLDQTQAMPVQAVGHTDTISNVHIKPGRNASRVYQFGRDVPVVVLGRKVLPAPLSAGAPTGTEPRMEGWLLVRRTKATAAELAAPSAVSPVSTAGAVSDRTAGSDIPVAGWVLERFIALDPPRPIPDYASSAHLQVIAWAVLDKVPSPQGEMPQYLLAGTRDGDGAPCDFTTLRVYTWSAAHQRYETAFLEDGLCGRLPIQVSELSNGAEFRFAAMGGNGAEQIYRLRDTIVRRVREDGAVPVRRR